MKMFVIPDAAANFQANQMSYRLSAWQHSCQRRRSDNLKAYVIDVNDNDRRRLRLRHQKRFLFPPNQREPDFRCQSLLL
jgi:hypothetical protein